MHGQLERGMADVAWPFLKKIFEAESFDFATASTSADMSSTTLFLRPRERRGKQNKGTSQCSDLIWQHVPHSATT